MNNQLRVVLAQTNFLMGAIEYNAELIIKKSLQARDELKANIIAFPELMLLGYPADDLLLRTETYVRTEAAIQKIMQTVSGIDIILGLPLCSNGHCYNSAIIIRDHQIIDTYHKQELPNYGVFDEKRYFTPGTKPCVFITKNGIRVGLIICEDLWLTQPTEQIKQTDAQLLISINASPFDIKKPPRREKLLQERAQFLQLPILYVNYIAGQDDILFDGHSLVADANGNIVQRGAFFAEELIPVDLTKENNKLAITTTHVYKPTATDITIIYKGLVVAIRDYVEKNNFAGIVLGLSGGIDSALTLALAVDAIGNERVTAIMMPSAHTSKLSLELAAEQAKIMQVNYSIIDIEPVFQTFLATLNAEFSEGPANLTKENLQARCRGVFLMAISNQKHLLALTTSNKSELAVGYSTLYGDMAGGFCALKDVYKTTVYELAHYRNSINPVIPEKVITRPPTAELSPNQKDQDSLPPYEILDEILKRYIESNENVVDIVNAGFNQTIVEKVINLIKRAEFKRHQSAPGARMTTRAFGKDWRYPITNGF